MTNYEKITKLVQHLQFMIDEELINEDACGTISEEIYSAMEILADYNQEFELAYAEDMKALSNLL